MPNVKNHALAESNFDSAKPVTPAELLEVLAVQADELPNRQALGFPRIGQPLEQIPLVVQGQASSSEVGEMQSAGEA
jgi:hypothetical protein